MCESIFVDESNALAWELAREVMRHPGGKYGLVYLYGVSGVGKTRILRAIETGLREQHPHLKVCRTNADELVAQLLHDLIHESGSAFGTRYRDTDVLLVDDIQYLAGKISTQQELERLFDAFCVRGKQLVITADCPPQDLERLNPHLQRRLESTAVARIRQPGETIRRAIVEQESRRLSLDLPEAVTAYLTDRADNPFRLLGLVRRVAVAHELEDMPLDLAHIQSCLQD